MKSFGKNESSTSSHLKKDIPVFRFPKKSEEKNRRIQAVPNANLIVNESTVVCELHWPAGYETKSVNGKLRRKNPPSVWPGVPVSQIPSTFKPSKEPAFTMLKLK